jgi:hypothetical protein
MLYNRCTGIYRFGNNTYPRRIRHKSNLGHICRGKMRLIGREIRYVALFRIILIIWQFILHLWPTIIYHLKWSNFHQTRRGCKLISQWCLICSHYFPLLWLPRYILSSSLLTVSEPEITNVGTCEHHEALVYLSNIETLGFWFTYTQQHRDPSLQ